MAEKSKSALTVLAETIRDELSEEANSASRVGSLLIDMIDSLRSEQEAISYPDSGFVVTGGSVSSVSIGSNELRILTTSGATYTLPELSSLANKVYIVQLKNDSGGNVTVVPTGSDTIDGETSVTLIDKESLSLYLTGSQYKVI